MSTLDDARKRVFSVARQLASAEVRRKALTMLRPGDVVRAMDSETGGGIGDRRLTGRNVFGLLIAEGPERPWFADADGRECESWGEPKPGGWMLVAPWASTPVVRETPRERHPFSWALYERHMEATWKAVVSGEPMPEAPWQEI